MISCLVPRSKGMSQKIKISEEKWNTLNLAAQA